MHIAYHKLQFSVSERWATSAYRTGPIYEGRWRTLPPDLHAAAEPGWLRGDLHCHTVYSDGDSWPADMLAGAVARGLDFLGVTDHSQTGHHPAYAAVTGEHLPIILPGIEVTTYGGHWNAWAPTPGGSSASQPPQPRVTPCKRQPQVARRYRSTTPNRSGRTGSTHALGYHAIEVWNGDWQRMNHVSLSWWETQLRAGRRIVALGGSDTHKLKQIDADARHGRHLGLPTTWAQVGDDRSTDGVLNALRAGRVFISRDVDGPQLFFALRGQIPCPCGGCTPRNADAHVRTWHRNPSDNSFRRLV